MNVFDDIDAINTVIENCKESNVLDWIAEIMCDHTEEFYGIGRAVHREMDIQTAKRILSEDGRVSLTKSDYRDYCIYIASKEFSELLYKITEQED